MKMHKLLDICDFQGGTQPPKDEWVDTPQEGYVRMLQIRDYSQGNEKFIQYVKDTPKLHKCREDDIMLSRYGYIGQAFRGLAGAYNVALVKVVKKEKIDTQYLFYYFQSGYFQRSLLSNVGSRATIPGFNKTELKATEIPVPILEEQRSIGEKLKKIDKLIERYNRQIELMDELVKARFVEMFGNIILNEKCWKTDKWSNVLKIVNGKNQKAVESDNGEYLICGSGGAMGRATEYLTNEDSVIIGRKGSINKPLLMREKYWNVDTAFGIEPNRKYINVDYLYMFCIFFDFEKLNKAVTIPSLTKADLLNIEMPIPDILLQEQFAAFVHQVDKSKLLRYIA